MTEPRIGVFWTYHIAKPAGQTQFVEGGYASAWMEARSMLQARRPLPC